MSKREIIQQEALDMAIKHKRCGLGISMGVGKTLIGLKYIDHFRQDNKLRVLVVAPKLSIFESWKDDGTKFNVDVNDLEFTTYLSLNKLNPNNYDLVVLDECHSLLDSHRDFLENFNGKIVGLTGTPPKYEQSEKGRMVRDFCPIVYKFITDEAVENKILNDYQIIVHMLSLDAKKNFFVKTKA